MREGRRKHINSGEDALFREAVSDVRPLKRSRRHAVRPGPPARVRTKPATETGTPDDIMADSSNAAELEPGATLSFRRPHVSERTLRRLRRGYYPIQRCLDLHGLTASQAARELAAFIDECALDRVTCVRIVHGKGLRSGSRGPVLKAQVANCLRRCAGVLAYGSAPSRDGGTGAVYVLMHAGRRHG